MTKQQQEDYQILLEHHLSELRKIEQQENKDLLEAREEARKMAMTDIEAENERFEQQLTRLGLFQADRQDMTAEDLSLLESLERIHQDKLDAIDAKAMSGAITRQKEQFEREKSQRLTEHNLQMAQITNLEQAKDVLRATISEEELRNVRTMKEARALLEKQYQERELREQRDFMERLLSLLLEVSETGMMEGLDLSDSILSEEEKEELEKRIIEISALVAELSKAIAAMGDDGDSEKPRKPSGGRSWGNLLPAGIEILFDKEFRDGLQEQLELIDRIATAVGALGRTWERVGQMISGIEQRNLQEFEKAQAKKKERLSADLEAGRINQEQYQRAVQRLDTQTEEKRARVARRQAVREKAMAIAQATMQTAVAVTEVLPNVVLAAIIAALGAAEVAAIVATPIPGAEKGGYLDVTRSQDKKKFRAKYDPSRRGYVDEPTVLVGEGGSGAWRPRTRGWRR